MAVNSLQGATDPISKGIVDAKGDLIVGTTDNTIDRLVVGNNGQMLMADSGSATGLRYVDPPENRNLIINGAMQVHQRGTSTANITGNGYYTADRWRLTVGMGTWTNSVENDAPTGSGLSRSLKMLCTTAKASPAAGDILNVGMNLEGQDLQRIKKGTSSAEQLTLSFWVKSNVTGTYAVELFDQDNARQISASYTVSASATWERKVITFASDTTGALDNDNANSLQLSFWLGVGSNFSSGTLGTTWASNNNANRAVGQTNLAAATNNYWQITGVQLETGPVATPFEFEPTFVTQRKCGLFSNQSPAVGNIGPILVGPEERCNIVAAAATGTINIDTNTSTVWYYTSNATANHTLNIRGDASNSLNNMLLVGDSITVVWINTNGATPYYPNVVQIDGSNVTPRWQGGTAPSAGNASSTDVYTFTIIKTATTPTYVVLGSQTRFA